MGRDRRKRTTFRPVDALESSKLILAVAGDTFTSASSQNGKLFSWGKNEKGQLGVGDRENHSRPKAASSLYVVQLEAGANHTIGLTTSGIVTVWGAGSSGQMGNGQSLILDLKLFESEFGCPIILIIPLFKLIEDCISVRLR